MFEAATPSTQRRRPRIITFVVSLLLIESVLVILLGLLAGAEVLIEGSTAPLNANDAFGPIVDVLPGLSFAITIVVGGGGLAIAGLGLLHTREWAWILAMALQGLGLTNALYWHLQGVPQHLTLALCSFVVLVLNQREVRLAFAAPARHV